MDRDILYLGVFHVRKARHDASRLLMPEAWTPPFTAFEAWGLLSSLRMPYRLICCFLSSPEFSGDLGMILT